MWILGLKGLINFVTNYFMFSMEAHSFLDPIIVSMLIKFARNNKQLLDEVFVIEVSVFSRVEGRG